MRCNVSENQSGILNPFYSFDSFVVGAGNRSAHAAALAVSGNLGTAYNPLFIYGEGGLGKSHLLGAIGNKIKAQNKRANVIVSSPSAFMKETMDGTHSAELGKYYAMIRTAEVLLLDDFQEMAGEISIRKEFLHTVELLHERRTQIVITSDRMPGDIPKLDARLLARIDEGFLAVIQPPDRATRVAILKVKAEQNRISIPDDVVNHLGSLATGNVRELEGMLLRLGAYSTLTNVAITMAMAREILDNAGYNGRSLPCAWLD